MKHKTLIAAGAAAILCAAAVRAGGPVEEAPADSVSDVGFMLADYGGCVAVFRADCGLPPEQVTAIRVGLLPAPDRQRLAEGIRVSGEEELARLLEDLSG